MVKRTNTRTMKSQRTVLVTGVAIALGSVTGCSTGPNAGGFGLLDRAPYQSTEKMATTENAKVASASPNLLMPSPAVPTSAPAATKPFAIKNWLSETRRNDDAPESGQSIALVSAEMPIPNANGPVNRSVPVVAQPVAVPKGAAATPHTASPRQSGLDSLKQSFRKITSRNGSSERDSAFQAAREKEWSGDYSAALAAYQTLLETHPQDGPSLHRHAVCADMCGQPAVAEVSFQQALSLAPEDVELVCDCGFHYQSQGNAAAAQHYYEHALTLAPEHQRAHNHLGILLSEAGQQTPAQQHFVHAGLNQQQIADNLQQAQLR